MRLFKSEAPTSDEYGPWWRNSPVQNKLSYVFGFVEAAGLAADLLMSMSVALDGMDEVSSRAITRDITVLYLEELALQMEFSIQSTSDWAAMLEDVYSNPENAKTKRTTALDHLRSHVYNQLSPDEKQMIRDARKKKAMGE